MKSIEIKNIEDLKRLDLSNFKVEEDVEFDIKLRLYNENFEYPIKLIHEKKGLSSKISIKLALFGKSFIKIPTEIHVKKNAIDTATGFKALVLLMSPQARATVTPGLFIEEKNILSASHGVVIKNIKDKDLVYLRARGIEKQSAREMIVGM